MLYCCVYWSGQLAESGVDIDVHGVDLLQSPEFIASESKWVEVSNNLVTVHHYQVMLWQFLRAGNHRILKYRQMYERGDFLGA